jgi:hypothetical protein
MVELTHGGTWLKWSSLNRRDRNWALASFVTSFLAAIPLYVLAAQFGASLGYRAGSGGKEMPPEIFARIVQSDLFSYVTVGAAACAVIGAITWWRFSRNQDEMFNRIQNYALGHGGAWTLAIVTLWWLLSLGGWLGPLQLGAVFAIGFLLVIAFWYAGVRRWA